MRITRLRVLAAMPLLLAGCAPLPPPLAAVPATDSCTSGDGLAALCGAVGVEDLVVLPGGRWVVGSGLNLGRPAQLVLIDAHARSVAATYPDPDHSAPLAAYSDCAAPPDPATMSFSGLSLTGSEATDLSLLAVNHGDRKAVEVFRITGLPDQPRLAWEGCALLPADSDPNGVAALPDGRLVVSDFRGSQPDAAWTALERGQPVGGLLLWQAGQGTTRWPGGGLSGPNGLAVSTDGATLYISDWGGRRLVTRDLASGTERALALPFLPDNIDILPDGRLLVAGQATRPAAIGACTGPACPQPWLVALVDPASGAVTRLVERAGTVEANYATSAALTDGMLYVTVRGMDRVVLVPLDRAP